MHRLAHGVALLTLHALAPGAEPWEWLVVLTISSGRTSSLETYASDDFDAALARFEELTSAG